MFILVLIYWSKEFNWNTVIGISVGFPVIGFYRTQSLYKNVYYLDFNIHQKLSNIKIYFISDFKLQFDIVIIFSAFATLKCILTVLSLDCTSKTIARVPQRNVACWIIDSGVGIMTGNWGTHQKHKTPPERCSRRTG